MYNILSFLKYLWVKFTNYLIHYCLIDWFAIEIYRFYIEVYLGHHSSYLNSLGFLWELMNDLSSSAPYC